MYNWAEYCKTSFCRWHQCVIYRKITQKNMPSALRKQNKSKCQKDKNHGFPTNKQITKHLNFRISGHLNLLNLKLNEAIDFPYKISHYVPIFLLKVLYYTNFDPDLIFACQIWGQNINTLKKIQALKDEAVPIIDFRTNNYDVGELYKNDKLLRISEYIKLLNCKKRTNKFANPPFPKIFY